MSAFKRILDDYNMGLYEFLKDIGMVKSILKYNKIYNDPKSTISDIDIDVLLALSYKFGVTVDELLDKYDKNGINYRINIAKNHGNLIKKRMERMKKGTVSPIEHVTFENGDNYVRLAYKEAKLEAARKMTLVDNGQEVDDLVRAKNSPACAGDDEELEDLDSLEDFDEAENIPMRADGEELDDLKHFQPNDTLFHNKVEANRIFKRLRRLKEEFARNPAGMSNKRRVMPRYNLSPIPNTYAALCPCYLEYKWDDEEDNGAITTLLSVFNKRNEFVFSEAYTVKFEQDGDYKGIKYYKKVFYDIISPDMELEFTKDDEISEGEYYHGLYRQYRVFGFQV